MSGTLASGGTVHIDITRVSIGLCKNPNAAPTVDAGEDLHRLPNPDVLIQAAYADPDAGDTHTATLDWGDGLGPQPALAADGIVTAAASFKRGVYGATVCVADSAGATGCDTLTITIDGAHGKPSAGMLPGAGKANGGPSEGWRRPPERHTLPPPRVWHERSQFQSGPGRRVTLKRWPVRRAAMPGHALPLSS